MGEVTIDVPEQHVPEIRYRLLGELSAEGDELSRCHRDDFPRDELHALQSKINAWTEALDELGWGNQGDRQLTLPKPVMTNFLTLVFESASEGINAGDRGKARAQLDRARWAGDVLDEVEPEAVAV